MFIKLSEGVDLRRFEQKTLRRVSQSRGSHCTNRQILTAEATAGDRGWPLARREYGAEEAYYVMAWNMSAEARDKTRVGEMWGGAILREWGILLFVSLSTIDISCITSINNSLPPYPSHCPFPFSLPIYWNILCCALRPSCPLCSSSLGNSLLSSFGDMGLSLEWSRAAHAIPQMLIGNRKKLRRTDGS